MNKKLTAITDELSKCEYLINYYKRRKAYLEHELAEYACENKN